MQTIHAAYVWFMNDFDSRVDWAGLSAYSAEWTQEQMRNIKGRCANKECRPNGEGCYSIPPCVDDNDCPFDGEACLDTTIGKRCFNYSSWLPCFDYARHPCMGMRNLYGFCYGGRCLTMPGRPDAPCGISVPRCGIIPEFRLN